VATLHKHGPLIGIYVSAPGLAASSNSGSRSRYACFEDGTVLRNRPNGMGGWQGWTKSAFNAQRLLSGKLLQPDTSTAAQAIMNRVNADSRAHEGHKLRRRIERR
jgi:hypothetical protein